MRNVSIVILVFFSFPCLAQVQIYSLEGLFAFADKNSAQVRQAKLQPAISRQDVSIQSSGLYPKVNAFATGDYYPIIATQVIPAEVLGGQPGTYLKAQFGLPYVFTSGVELTMPVINLEKWSQLSKAKAQYDQAQWSSSVAIENLHLQLIQSYYQYLVTKEVNRLNDENVNTSAELMRIMDERKGTGVVNPTDYNRSKNLSLDVKTSASNYQRSLQQSLNNLRSLLNIDAGTELDIYDSITGFTWPLPDTISAVENRPSWHEAQAKEEVAKQAFRESKNASLPKLNLNGRYAYNLQSKLQSGSNDVTFDVSNINLRLDIPLFQGNYYRSIRRKNALLLETATLEKTKVSFQLEEQQRNWFQQYITAFNKQDVLKEKVIVSADNLRIARLSMSEGVMEFDEFNNIFMEYNRARMDYIQNQADGILYYLLSNQKF